MSWRTIHSSLLTFVACLCVTPVSWAALSSYSQDFEGLDAGNPDALSGDGWQVAGLVFDMDGNFKFFYGNFPAPNGGPGFSGIISGQGGPDQGAQQLSVYSDYNCCFDTGEGHFNGTDLVESRVLQEQTIEAGDVGQTWEFSFDGKAGDLAGSTTALAFIQTLDPDAGFVTTNFISVDTTDLPDTWGSFTLSLFIDADLEGQLLQFGFQSVSSNFEMSQNIYDNVEFAEVFTLSEAAPAIAGQDNTWTTTNGTPINRHLLYFGRPGGSTPVNIGACSTTIDLGNARLIGNATADGAGSASITRFVPGGVAGRTLNFQALDFRACNTSNVQPTTFN